MTNNTEGLTPILRPQLGIGFNRALPSAFGFDNGLKPDGVNDYLTIPRFGGRNFPSSWTIEFWAKDQMPAFNLYNNPNSQAFSVYQNGANMLMRIRSSLVGSTLDNQVLNAISPVGRFLYNIRYDGINNPTKINYVVSSGGISLVNNVTTTISTLKPTVFAQSITGFVIGATSGGGNSGPGISTAFPIDEFRIYTTYITDTNITSNYNSGIGNAPFETENLLTWYQFEQFETLDFSALQDNSDLRLGIKDLSGKFYHAQPVNMDTNPLSSSYVLKPSLL